MVAKSLVKQYKDRAFHSSETEGCGEAYGTSAEEMRILDLARLERRLVFVFFSLLCVDLNDVVISG